MPFTLAHAAAALPLRRVLRDATVFPALVIGCFLPDVPYFLPEPLCDINAHQWPALMLFGVPCGWILYLGWYRVLRAPVVALLPLRYSPLLWSAGKPPPRAPFATTLSFVAGALSHVLWDAFTHRRGFVVHAWRALAEPVVRIEGHAVPAYALFQHGSTALGIAMLALAAWRWLREHTSCDARESPPPLAPRTKARVIASLALGTAALVVASFASGRIAPSLYELVCCSISSAAIALFVHAGAYHLVARRR